MRTRPTFISLLLVSVLSGGLLFLPVIVLAAPTESLISTNISSATVPAISGDYIVWQDNRNGNDDIYLYNIITGEESRITTDLENQWNPKIYRDIIVWQDFRSGFGTPSIYAYNITTGGPELQVSDGSSSQTVPIIFGNRIVWSDDRSGISQIFLNGTTPGSELPLSSNTGSQYNPAIYGNLVVWYDDRSGTNQDIYLYDMSSLSETQVTDESHDQSNPALYGVRSVWEDWRNGDIQIFINGTDPGKEYSISPNKPGISSRSPEIFDGKVVWTQSNVTGGDIVMNDTITGIFIPVAVDPLTAREEPAIYIDPVYGDRIVWQDSRSGYNQIYLYSSTGPGTCPVAAFTSDFTGGNAPVTVRFSDITPAGSTHWFWDFGDGTTSTDQNPVHTYSTNDPNTVILTVSNPWCRNATGIADYVVVGKPIANFMGNPTSDIVPATISFSDTSGGTPDTWNWSFGDGSWFNTTDSARKNVVHVYTTPGTYTVSLLVNNTFGSDTRTRAGYITALNGANEIANSTINGIVITNCGGPQTITVDTATVSASLIPNASVLEIQPPEDRGFKNITVYSLDGTGFIPAGTTFTGNVTSVHIQTREIIPAGFSSTGPVSVNYSVDLPSYPCDATLTTKVWEGTTAEDRDKFERIALGSTFAHWLGTLYTTKITKTNFPATGTAQLHMSADSAWVAGNGGETRIYFEHILDDGQSGEVLPTRYISHDPAQNLDYFEADSPRGLSTFGLSALSGSGNPLQLITLTIASHVSPPQNSVPESDSEINTAGGTKTPTPTATPAPASTATTVPGDPGNSAKVYTNANGLVTQATRLQSNDGKAVLTIGEGVVAKDAAGKPLAEITIKSVPPGSLPPIPPGTVFTFAGMAYEIGPDGASFSPPMTLTFTLPQAQWGMDYTAKSFDRVSGTWVDLPTRYDASTGRVTVQISGLCCFALFTVPQASSVATPAATLPPLPPVPLVKAQPPATAVTIFTGMMGWVAVLVMNNLVILVAALIVAIALFLIIQDRSHGFGK